MDTTAGCPCLVLRCTRQSGREIGIAERERKGDMTQGHMDRSGGGGATRLALLCVDRFFLSSRIGCVLCGDDVDLYLLFCFEWVKKKSQETNGFCGWTKNN